MTRLLDQLEEHRCGLLISVDEVKADLDEIVTLAAVYQLFVSENRRVSLVMAGLPYHVHRLVTHKTVSFLRRSWQYELGPVPDADVSFALRSTFAESGKTIDEEALELCVDAIKGFPYMIQLVGYRVWEEANDSNAVTLRHAERGWVAFEIPGFRQFLEHRLDEEEKRR